MGMIAGHTFDLLGCRCTCFRKFSDISSVTVEDIGKPGWAHVGGLNEKEYTEIVTERDRLWKAHLESGVD